VKRFALLSLVVAVPAWAKPADLDPSNLSTTPLPLLGLLAVMALVPFAIIMVTSFSKMAVVLSIARSALGTQQAPPTMVLTGLAAVLSAHVMAPVCERMFTAGKAAYEQSPTTLELVEAAPNVALPLKDFLVKHGSADERARFVDMAKELRTEEEAKLVNEQDLTVVVPAFVITELKEAFVIGFLIFLPFLILDMLTANVLLALGMQTLSPSQVSLPFKILLFVAVDGWALLSHGLILGYR
jgi:type III secretion protein R